MNCNNQWYKKKGHVFTLYSKENILSSHVYSVYHFAITNYIPTKVEYTDGSDVWKPLRFHANFVLDKTSMQGQNASTLRWTRSLIILNYTAYTKYLFIPDSFGYFVFRPLVLSDVYDLVFRQSSMDYNKREKDEWKGKHVNEIHRSTQYLQRWHAVLVNRS